MRCRKSCSILILTVAALFCSGESAPPAVKSDFDRFLQQLWQQQNIVPAPEAADTVMVRRLYIDLLGRVPTPAEARAYLADKNKDKQAQLVGRLLASEEHAMFMTMRFGDELRIKSEFPVNLWPNAAFLYSRTIYQALKDDLPFDELTRRLLLADGSNFRNGYVNFFRAVSQKQPGQLADAAAGFLLDKSFDRLGEEEKQQFLHAFSHIRFKSTREWKEEIVYSILPPEDDPRRELVENTIARKEFAVAVVRRLWRWIFGSCIVDRQITEFLAGELQTSGFKLRPLIREICTSAAYRVESMAAGNREKMLKFAAVYPVRRLDAEVLADSIAQITGMPYTYTSVIPEPFSYYRNRASALPDGSVTDQFLLLFGRPSRDTGKAEERKRDISADQRMYLFNSADINNRLNNILRKQLKNEKDKFGALYMLFYSRMPTPEERRIFKEMSKKGNNWKVLSRMPWVLLNSGEFLYQH